MQHDLWVFGYGSLMWRPGFDYVECRTALLRGYHRAMCVLSENYRGKPGQPGLVLGLDRGGACRGRAYRVAPKKRAEALAYLHEREMNGEVYLPRDLHIRLDDGRKVLAHGYVVDRSKRSYFRTDDPAEAARIIARASGLMGPCRDYLANTVAHLEAMGIAEGALHQLLFLVDAQPYQCKQVGESPFIS